MLKVIDYYIIRKFLGTFFFALGLIILVSIIFDFSERVDDFIEKSAPMHAIIFDYYLNFIPYFANLFSFLFVFIAVIFFTSNLSTHSEIKAILSTGVSYHRFMLPYFISALLIAVITFVMAHYLIPYANVGRLNFEDKYIKKTYGTPPRNIHKQIAPGVFIYMESYNSRSDFGSKFSMERYENGKLVSKLMADYIQYDSINKSWRIRNYWIRKINGMKETVVTGVSMDTTLNMWPKEFKQRSNVVEAMTTPALKRFIHRELIRGHGDVYYYIELYRRTASAFAVFILTLIGVTLSCQPIRGGRGM
ncbi:MAG: LptF/LptG family permease, partial [Bacteroidales bacterium]|nr:LptF/LptG family permease [Bacteroidales bacterium]